MDSIPGPRFGRLDLCSGCGPHDCTCMCIEEHHQRGTIMEGGKGSGWSGFGGESKRAEGEIGQAVGGGR